MGGGDFPPDPSGRSGPEASAGALFLPFHQASAPEAAGGLSSDQQAAHAAGNERLHARAAPDVLRLGRFERDPVAGSVSLQPAVFRSSVRVSDRQLHQRACRGVGRAQPGPNTLGPRAADPGPDRPGACEQGDCLDAQHQRQYGQPAPAGDPREAAGEELHRGVPHCQGAAAAQNGGGKEESPCDLSGRRGSPSRRLRRLGRTPSADAVTAVFRRAHARLRHSGRHRPSGPR